MNSYTIISKHLVKFRIISQFVHSARMVNMLGRTFDIVMCVQSFLELFYCTVN